MFVKKNIEGSCVCAVSFDHIFSPLSQNYQELGGAEKVQGEGLDPGVVDAQLPVDTRALDAGEDA